MTADDLHKPPKPWKLFFGGVGDQAASLLGFNVPASVDVLSERTEENIATYLPNYVRLAAAVVLLTFYLRPKALLGAAAVSYTMYTGLTRTLRQQQQQQQDQAAAAATARGGAAAQPRHPYWGDDPNEPLVAAATMVVTWVAVAYTRCLPIMVLGVVLAASTVLLHAATRRGASEYRYRGNTPLGYSLLQVLGRQPAPAGSDPCLVFRQLWHDARLVAAQQASHLARWAKYYLLGAWDAARRPFSRSMRGVAEPPTGWE